MKITVFGSTGRAGSAIVERALDMGHEVATFARSPERLAWLEGRPRLSVVPGDALDQAAVESAVEGAEAVVTALGTGTLDPSTHLSEMTANIVKVMQAVGPTRLVALSHVGVLLKKVDPRYQHVADEHRRNLRVLQDSGLDWIAVCPPEITDEPAHGHTEPVPGARGPNWSISRFDLADFMLERLDGDEFLRQTVGVSN